MARKLRRKTGSYIVEGAAGLLILIPLLVLITYATLQVSRAYMINAALQQAAQEGARLIATNYASHPSIASVRSDQEKYSFSVIKVDNIINDPGQFSAVFAPNASSPTDVTVTVTYPSAGDYGLPPFPDPDYLKLGSNFTLTGTARYTLE